MDFTTREENGVTIMNLEGRLDLASGSALKEQVKKLFEEEKFEELCKTYPETPAAKKAEMMMAEKLYNEKKYDELIAKYPNTAFAKKALAEKEGKKAPAPKAKPKTSTPPKPKAPPKKK